MRRTLLALPLAFALFADRPARADPPPPAAPAEGQTRIVAHKIEVRFEPGAHRLVAKDVLTFDTSAGRNLVLRFHPNFKVAIDPALPAVGSGNYDLSTILPQGTNELSVTCSGEVFDAVQKKDDLSWVVGDSTRGLISEKGIYLSGNSGWYPTTANDGLMRFDVTSYVPEPFLVVTQGSVPERSTVVFPKGWTSDTEVAPAGGGSAEPGVAYAKSVCVARIPTDGLDLSAGPYKTMTRSVEGIDLTTYFLEGEAADAPLWLDAADETVRRYEKILGSYPHPKFDVVENFFATGYGMPSYTLLGDEVIRYVTAGAKRSGGKIPPGYLDHEYVHGWYGNGLFVDPKDGNWCEALTTYFSNYLAKEIESKEAGLEHRRGVLEHFAIRVKGDKDHPVREFRTKTEDADNDVGYGKGSLIFHMLRKRLGDGRFFAAVKDMSAARVGTFVSWADWLKALDGEWVRPWLERKGLPAVRLAAASAWPSKSLAGSVVEWNLRIEAVQDVPRGGEPWPAMDLPVAVNGETTGFVRLDGKSVVWRGTVNAEPKTVEIDPAYDMLRRIADDDLPPCLNRTLETAGGAVSWRGAPTVLEPLAKRLASEKGLTSVSMDDASARARVALTVLQPGEEMRALGFEAGASGIKVAGQTFAGAEYSLLASWMTADGLPATRFVALSDDAAARAKYVTYYGWDQYVVFKAGRPVARGFLDRDPHGTRRPVARDDDAAMRIDAGVAHLASDEFEGRRPMTAGHDRAALWLQEALTFAGFSPAFEKAKVPFGLGVADLKSSRDLILTTMQGTETLHDAFWPAWFSGEHERGRPIAFSDFPLALAPKDYDEAGLGKILANTTGPVLPLQRLPENSKLAPLFDAPNALTPSAGVELARPGRGGLPYSNRPLAPWIAARRTRALASATIAAFPVILLDDRAADRIWSEPRVTAVDFEVKFSDVRKRWAEGKGGENLVMQWMPPGVAGDKPPVVVVSAHYDSHGKEGNVFFRGADDNASGVCCVLEALGALRAEVEKAGGAKVGLVVCLFDGEEWGLQGSRALVKPLLAKYEVKAVVNVDAVGRVRDDSVYVLGLSTVPDLAAKAVEALKGEGLKVGPDIDKYGYAEGSDHWPFHEAGVPAIDFYASDYGTMDTPDDLPDLVDPVGVARLSKALRALLVRLVRE